MMDTVLNLGLNDRSVEGLAKQTDGDVRFARDAYRRFIQMFGKIVMDVPADAFEHALDEARRRRARTPGHRPGRGRPERADRRFRAIYREHTGSDCPTDPREQLSLAIEASSSRGTASARDDYRRQNKISDDLGTAVNVVAMVFGNRGRTRAPRRVHARSLQRREAAVWRLPAERAGRGRRGRHPQHLPLARLEELDATSYRQLMEVMKHARGPLPRHVRHRVHDREGQALDPADEGGQADRVRRMGDGVRHAGGGLIDEGEALLRVDANRLEELFKRRVKADGERPIAKGLNASPAPPPARWCSRPTTPRSARTPATRWSWSGARPPRTTTTA
jgi:pyruvate,orthophosphate dikinase